MPVLGQFSFESQITQKKPPRAEVGLFLFSKDCTYNYIIRRTSPAGDLLYDASALIRDTGRRTALLHKQQVSTWPSEPEDFIFKCQSKPRNKKTDTQIKLLLYCDTFQLKTLSSSPRSHIQGFVKQIGKKKLQLVCCFLFVTQQQQQPSSD